MKIVETLNPVLPERYTAGPRVYLGGSVEIDIGTFDRYGSREAVAGYRESGNAVWTATEPTLRADTQVPAVDEYEVLIHDTDHSERLVAAIEIVSPSNKDRPDTRRAFVAKCAALLRQHVSVTIVDIVTSRGFNLYGDLLDFLGLADPSVGSPPVSIYAAASRAILRESRWSIEAWHRPLAIGQPLPVLPIWLADNLVIPLDLEASYEETCRALRIKSAEAD